MSILNNIDSTDTIFSLLAAYFLTNAIWLYGNKDGPPRVPYYIPLLGHTYQLVTGPAKFLAECRKKYGNVFVLYYLGEQVTVFAGAEAREMIKIPDHLAKEPRDRIIYFSDAIAEWKGADGLPEPILEPAAVVKNNVSHLLKKLLPEVLAQVDKSVDGILGTLEKPIVVDAHSFLSEIVISTVGILLAGHEMAKNESLKKIMRTYFSEVEKIMKQGIFWKFFPLAGHRIAKAVVRAKTPSLRVRRELKTIFASVLSKRKSATSPANNVLDSLIDEGYNLDQISHVMMILIFASISTTTNTCLVLLGDLMAFPKYIELLKEEQSQILKESQVVTKEHIDQMVCLNSAIRETLRHRGHRLEEWRIPTKPYILRNGVKIPKGSLMAADCTSLHFDEAEYPSPYEYNPLRFVESGPNASRVTAYFVGFGAGRHACPGRFFAVQEVTAIMSTLLKKCDFSTEDGLPRPFNYMEAFPKSFKVVMTKNTYHS